MGTARTRAYLTARFETGDVPTGVDFDDLIASYLNLTDHTSDDITEGSTKLFNQVPSGGSTDDILAKSSGTDYDFGWSTPYNIQGLSAGAKTELEGSNWDANEQWTGSNTDLTNAENGATHFDNTYSYYKYSGTWYRSNRSGGGGSSTFRPNSFMQAFNFDFSQQTAWSTSGSPSRGDTVIDVSPVQTTFTEVGTGMLVSAAYVEKDGSANYYTFPSTMLRPGDGDFTVAFVVSTGGSWGNDAIIECANGHSLWVNWNGAGMNYNWGGSSPGGNFTIGTLATDDTKLAFIFRRSGGTVSLDYKASGGSWATNGTTLTSHDGDFRPNHFKLNNDDTKCYFMACWTDHMSGDDLTNLQTYIDNWL